MTKDVTDLFQRSTLFNQIRREAVAQNVRTHIGRGRFQTSPGKGTPQDEIQHLTIFERSMWRA